MLTRHAMVAAMTAMVLAGCEANQLYMAYQTNIGIHAAVNPQMTEGTLSIGYRRDFAAIVPRSVPVSVQASTPLPGGGSAQGGGAPASWDAMAALVCSDLLVSGIWLDRYEENLATGQAAITLAKALADEKRGAQARQFFTCFQPSTPTAPSAAGEAQP